MNRIQGTAFLLCMQSLVAVASTSEPAPATATATATATAEAVSVYVVGTRDPDWKTYRAFLAGMDVFTTEHSHAPDAALRFLLTPRQPGLSYQGLTLRIATDERSIAVPVATDGSFTLPYDQAAADAGAELLLNRKRELFRWRPSIRSPGVEANARRLGDLRLECAVRWAVEQADFPGFVRVVARALGGACQSARVKVDFVSEQAIRDVHLVDGARREALPRQSIEQAGHVFLPPLHDASWSDDTVLEFDYESAGQ